MYRSQGLCHIHPWSTNMNSLELASKHWIKYHHRLILKPDDSLPLDCYLRVFKLDLLWWSPVNLLAHIHRRHWFGYLLVQMLACHLFCTKPSPKQYWRIDHQLIKTVFFVFFNALKCRLRYTWHFVPTSIWHHFVPNRQELIQWISEPVISLGPFQYKDAVSSI